MTIVRIALAAEYGTYAVWITESGNSLPETVTARQARDRYDLPLSDVLCDSIHEWDEEFQETYCDEYPPWGGFPDQETANRWLALGRKLAERLRQEIGPEISVEYDEGPAPVATPEHERLR